MKTYKFLAISLALITVLSACNFPSSVGSPTQTVGQYLTGSVAAMTLQVNATQTPTPFSTLVDATPVTLASPISTPFPPNTPVWTVYTYTCQLADGGGTMTMNLAWSDRSTSETGYRVYRNDQVIATLAPDSTFYVDVAFVATGQTLSYFIEAFTAGWQVRSSIITYGCQ